MPETSSSVTQPSIPTPLAGVPTTATPAEVRQAAEALKSAIDAHLRAVESRVDELDPAVLEAFDALAAAAEEYDELLYAVHDEVTPFEVMTDSEPEYAGPDEVEALSVFIRRDYLVADPDALTAAARTAAEGVDPETATTRTALLDIFDSYDADEIAYRADELGLQPADSTMWVVAADPEGVVGWHDDPFSEVDAELVLYRDDVIDEDSDDEDDEDEDELEEAEDMLPG
ncbi:hypothetical protein [Actinospica sp.]|jgi:hypothetical protein|uniref:hypothetical protein n=1 Tax=Actinospica sp. TaxID=1872142 RepID=UPI002B5D01B1|nr:hypothetical protein [Actinospica sp.]HWG28197.1 hypothetical protein [Actinospica sp.]